jgi:hypothetical protein
MTIARGNLAFTVFTTTVQIISQYERFHIPEEVDVTVVM